jgi:3-methyl-2-oxobutanoate hydroxymethyltransferase
MNILDFKKMKVDGRKISVVTCYDCWTARLISQSQIDCVLVGDSLAMVVYGHPSTLQATPEMMAQHTAAVVRGVGDKFVIADMPFLSFRKGVNFAMETVDQLMKAGAHSVKLEGVWGHEDVIRHIVQSGVPVMGHLGLTPQSVYQFGGFKVQGKTDEAAEDLVKQAMKLEELGAFAVVLECIPSHVSSVITESIGIPTIGIGAGKDTDGQVLVLQDLLGMNTEFRPKFLREFLNGKELIPQALDAFDSETKSRGFPSEKESYL